MTMAMSQDLSRKATILVILLLAPIFFFLNHELEYTYEGASIENSVNYSEKIDFEERAIEGNLQRRIALFSIGLFALLGMVFTKRRIRFTYDEPLGWVLFFFGVWSLASVLWSIEVPLTIRKLTTFGLFCFLAAALASRFPVNFVPECVFYLTALYIAAGLSVEIASQTFQPWSGEYRFSGTVHPNIQAVNCTMMLFAAVSLAETPDRRRRVLYLSAATLGFVLLILTKSRTSLFCALLGFITFFIINSPNKLKTSAYIFGILCFFGILNIFIGEFMASDVKEVALLGRDTEETLTLTGRTSIWGKGLIFFGMRPLHGYGFNSFWTPPHIRMFSESMGWNIADVHSAYLDLLLSVGLVGLLSYLLILALGMKKVFSTYIKTRETGYAFLLMIFIFLSVHGLLESELIEVTSIYSFVFIWGLFYLAFPSRESVGHAA